MLFGSKKRQPTPNSTWTLDFVQIVFGCDVTCDLCDSCDAPTYMHVSNEPHINHMQTYSPHVHTTIINYDGPLEKGMFIWFMRRWQHKSFLGHKNTISIWHPPNRDLLQTLFGRKSSRTGSNPVKKKSTNLDVSGTPDLVAHPPLFPWSLFGNVFSI